jgi:hypothetical protein
MRTSRRDWKRLTPILPVERSRRHASNSPVSHRILTVCRSPVSVGQHSVCKENGATLPFVTHLLAGGRSAGRAAGHDGGGAGSGIDGSGVMLC